jgi:hypothetical protein
MKKKPKPISKKISKKPAAPAPKVAAGINDVSPIIDAQMRRAEQAIDNLREEVRDIRKQPKSVQVTAPEPKVVVNMPNRPRIAKVTVKYDNFGYPSELIPQYDESAV